MAGSRLEKIGTIFTRHSGLLNSGALSWEDRPLWYDVYAAYPPFDEPTFNRPISNVKLKSIFYKEDIIRATIHKHDRSIHGSNLLDNDSKSLTHRFVEYSKNISAQNYGKNSKQELYLQIIEFLKQQGLDKKDEDITLSTAFKKSKSVNDKSKMFLNVADIFK